MKVKLQDVLMALEDADNDEIRYSYSVNKEKIVYFSDCLYNEDEYDEDDDYIDEPEEDDDYIDDDYSEKDDN